MLTGCAAPFYHYDAHYDVRLASVEPTGQIRTRALLPDSTIYQFTDGLLQMQWATSKGSRLNFVLTNCSPDTLRLIWKDARYVDERLDSHHIVHAGVRLTDQTGTSYNSVIPPYTSMVDYILPEHLIIANPARPDLMLQERPLITLRESTPRKLQREAQALNGKHVQILLPIAAKGATKSYRFTFQIENVTIY